MTVEQQIAAWRLACAQGSGARFPFRGAGASMWPTLRAGDEALFAPLAAPPAPGEILLYRMHDGLVAHRFRGALPDGRLRLRGDALMQDDPPVEPDAVIGRLVAVRRRGRERPIAPAALTPVYVALLPVLRLVRRLARP
jgi:hypothetical protein